MSVVQIASTAGTVDAATLTMSEHFDGLGRRWIEAFKNTANGIRTIVLDGKRDIDEVQRSRLLSSEGKRLETERVMRTVRDKIHGWRLSSAGAVQANIDAEIARARQRLANSPSEIAALHRWSEDKEILRLLLNADPVEVMARLGGYEGNIDRDVNYDHDIAFRVLDSPILAERLAQHIGAAAVEIAKQKRELRSIPAAVSELSDLVQAYDGLANLALTELGITQTLGAS